MILSVWLDNASLASGSGLAGFIGQWGAWSVRGIVGFAAIFLTFAYLKSRDTLDDISRQAKQTPLDRNLLSAHFLAMATFGALSWAFYGNHATFLPALVAASWLVVGCTGLALVAFALIPGKLWIRLVRETGALWIYAALAVVAACLAGNYSRSLWLPSGRFTFRLVEAFLSLFVPAVISDPSTMTLGTSRFSVQIAPQCSGFEGAGLMLAFGIIWLCLFRRESRFPQVLLLLPAGVATIYLLNAVRITALILDRKRGSGRHCSGRLSFSSKPAGSTAFNVVALGFSVAARRVSWFTTVKRRADTASDNPTATYLLPLLSILAVGLITAAASSDFEWLYPMRFLAAAGVLWIFRRKYAEMDWKFSWFGPAIGVAVFALWIALDAFLNRAATDAIPQALAMSSVPIRTTWIVFRALAAIITVPIAEELVFRGYFIRRLISPVFEALPLNSFTWLSLGVSSIAFGLLHGNLWFAGIIAGLLYGYALIRNGSIGQAVIAHATTNALLAGYVLMFHKWHLW